MSHRGMYICVFREYLFDFIINETSRTSLLPSPFILAAHKHKVCRNPSSLV